MPLKTLIYTSHFVTLNPWVNFEALTDFANETECQALWNELEYFVQEFIDWDFRWDFHCFLSVLFVAKSAHLIAELLNCFVA